MKLRSKKSNTKYHDLRARLIRRGYTLRKFALSRGYALGTVYDAAAGNRAGVKTTKIKGELESLAYGI